MKISQLLLAIAIAGCGLTGLKPQPVEAAEKITFPLSIWGEFQISVEDLAVFAQNGTITPKFAYYANRLDEKTLRQLRQILQTSFAVEPITVYRVTNMPMGEDFLRRLGNIIYTHPKRNGIYAIRAALIQAAGEPEGLTTIGFLRHFPTDEIQLNTDSIFAIAKEAESFFQYKDTTVKAIAQQAQSEANLQIKLDFAKEPDLRQSGQHQVTKQTSIFSIDDLRQTASGFAGAYDLNVDIYAPQRLDKPAPLAIIAHGLGSQRSDYDYLAKHLASHGYIVAVPEHAGSSNNYQEAFLRGEVNVDVSPVEFYSRPRDITHLLDSLEKHPDYQTQIDWSQVGILGHSFGGTTSLIASGAPVNVARIKDVCQSNRFTLNVSLFLQCRASNLPPGNYDLEDERIKAVAALNPVTSSVLGIENMSQIDIPTLIVGGTMDFVSPYIEEQVHPFLWLTTPHKYLATMVNGSHFSTISESNIAGVNDFLKGFRPDLGRDYLKALTLAFFETHLKDRSEYESYLTAAYAKNISNSELPLHLIQSLNSEQLQVAYGDTPPVNPIPEALMTVAPQKNRNVLAEIKRTGVLKVAMRTDAAPFGYTDDNKLTGYCADLAVALGDRLTKELNTSTPIQVVRESSSLANRFELVETEKAHLECGPNSIVSDKEGIVFSDPFFSSGTRFLINSDANNLDYKSPLKGRKLGVLEASTTESFIKQNYRDAEIVTFDSDDGTSKGIQAVTDGEIEAMVSDRVLLTAEIDRQGLNPQDYQIIPEHPLTCDYYGLILPSGDPQWRNTVNTFIHDTEGYPKELASRRAKRDRTSKQVFDKWLGDYYPQAVADLDYCQNRREE